MANSQPSDSSYHGSNEIGSHKAADGGRWYFSRKEIEENSPSRRDGIDLKKETYLRKSYCTFLQDLGMRLKVPQLTIATAIIFCHRFFLRQSHAKNDRRTIATVCMFLAGKVEETPRPLKDVIIISYEIIHKKDPDAVQRIKQKEVYEQQKELITLGERVVLATLGFDLNVHHPYKPLVEAIKKFKVAQNALAQVAWNFVNDGLRTSLCLQFKPHHIAAGAIFLAAKFLKVKLPSDGERVWWQEFDVTPRQLEEVSNQMLELYEQNRVPQSANSEAEVSNAGGATQRSTLKSSSGNEEHATTNSHSQAGGTSKSRVSKPVSRPVYEQSVSDNHNELAGTTQSQGNDRVSVEMRNSSDHIVDDQDNLHHGAEILPYVENARQAQNEAQERNAPRAEKKGAGEFKDKHIGRNLEHREATLGQSPQEALNKIDKVRDKVKAALEKRKSQGVARKTDLLDDNDLIERVLEDGIELPAESEKNKLDKRRNWSKPVNGRHQDDIADGQQHGMKGQLSQVPDFNSMEEGEVDMDWMMKSPKQPEQYYMDDQNRTSRLGYMESEHKRHVPMSGAKY